MSRVWLPHTYLQPGVCDAHGSGCEWRRHLDAWSRDDAFRLAYNADSLERTAMVAHNKFGSRFDDLLASAKKGVELAPRGAPFAEAFALFDAEIDGVPPALAVLRRSPKGWCASARLLHLAMCRARLSCWQLSNEMFGCWWFADPFHRGRTYPVPCDVANLPAEWKVGSFVLARVSNVDRRGYLLGVHSILDRDTGREVMQRAWDLAGDRRPVATQLLDVWQKAQFPTPWNTLPC